MAASLHSCTKIAHARLFGYSLLSVQSELHSAYVQPSGENRFCNSVHELHARELCPFYLFSVIHAHERIMSAHNVASSNRNWFYRLFSGQTADCMGFYAFHSLYHVSLRILIKRSNQLFNYNRVRSQDSSSALVSIKNAIPFSFNYRVHFNYEWAWKKSTLLLLFIIFSPIRSMRKSIILLTRSCRQSDMIKAITNCCQN